ncbi:Fe-Mn family superoxide dismutase [Autumnicola edwardsiae]|uniref:superoxide dismutase n=1 Tax=Autumnicola edwardsiae TaxID=3075594 RepID=A0ABU3CXJ1_9FLAO|nr:Fe-Mn family superoxide dismutase [Zunongwangia sp. F297]MDT0651031.1 Fe-Mn family superoxide dismutase [Zunongwangia sp. F297]
MPILVIDGWEHAYDLKYKNKRGDFVDTVLDIINWDNIAEQYNGAIILLLENLTFKKALKVWVKVASTVSEDPPDKLQ